MPAEPYPSYMPEINSSRAESGATAASWLAVAALWDAAFMEVEALGLLAAVQSADIAMTFQGLISAKLALTGPPFFAWLGLAGGIALMHAQACLMVAEAYGELETSIVPLFEVVQNRIDEAIAEATNIFGQNTPIIISDNMDYARMWTQDGTAMVDYDTALTVAMTPKPLPPPPIISNAAASAAEAAAATAQGEALNAMGATTRDTMQAVESNPLLQGASTAAGGAASSPMDMMGSMSGVLGAVTSAPQSMMGAVSSAPQSLMGPMQSMMSPAMSMMGQFSKPNMTGMDKLTGYSSVTGAFGSSGAGAAHGGLPLSAATGGGGGGGMHSGASLAAPTGSTGAFGMGVAPLMHSAALRGGALPSMAGSPGGPGGGGPGMMAPPGAHQRGAQTQTSERPVMVDPMAVPPPLHVKPDPATLRTTLS